MLNFILIILQVRTWVLFEFEFCVWVWVWAYRNAPGLSVCLLHITKLLQMFALMKLIFYEQHTCGGYFCKQFNLASSVSFVRRMSDGVDKLPIHCIASVIFSIFQLILVGFWKLKKKKLNNNLNSFRYSFSQNMTDWLTDWIQFEIGIVCSPLVCTSCARFKLFHRREHLWFCIQFNCKCFFFCSWMILMLICQNI